MTVLLRRLRAEDGVATVELAVVLPVLLLIILGVVWFGRYMNYSSNETHLAAVAARWAAVNVNPGSGTLQSYVLSQAEPELRTGSSDVTTPAHVYVYYPTGSSGTVGSSVRACVTSTVSFLPIFGLASAQVTETATMRLEQAPTNWTPDSSVPAGCPTS